MITRATFIFLNDSPNLSSPCSLLTYRDEIRDFCLNNQNKIQSSWEAQCMNIVLKKKKNLKLNYKNFRGTKMEISQWKNFITCIALFCLPDLKHSSTQTTFNNYIIKFLYIFCVFFFGLKLYIIYV